MLRIATLICVVAGLMACDDASPKNLDVPAGHALRGASVQLGATVAVDSQHTLHAGAASAAVISTNANGRLVAVIAD